MAKILVVDDEPMIADLVATLLKAKGHEVTAAYRSDEALEWCTREAPVLLISDVNMPGLSGIDLVRAVRTKCPAIQCILFSGGTDFDTAEIRQKLADLHVAATFQKPFVVADLLAAVQSTLDISHTEVSSIGAV